MAVPNILRKVPFKQKSNLKLLIFKYMITKNFNNSLHLAQNKVLDSAKSFLDFENTNTLFSFLHNFRRSFIRKGISIWI